MNKPKPKSRRHFLRGAGVALALPWMESLPPVCAGATYGGRGGCEQASAPLCHALLVERHQAGALVGQRQRRCHGVRSERGAAQRHAQDIVFIKGLFNEQAFRTPARTRAVMRQYALRRARVEFRPQRSSASARRWTRCSRKRSAAAPLSPAWRSASSPTNCASKTACR